MPSGASAGAAAIGNINGSVVLLIGNTPSAGIGLYFVRTSSPTSISEIFQIDNVINIVSSDGALSGTTSTDGKCNIRAESAAGKLWVENRTGSSHGYRVYVFG